VIKNNAYRFYSDAFRSNINYDIETQPLMDFGSVSFCAIHFALYTHPEKIFLIGCDTSNNGYFDKEQPPTWRPHMMNMTMQGYYKLKKYVSCYYPDIEIISVNPVGLRGVFKDVYTQSYIDEHPEVLRDNPNLEILDEKEFAK
jgi:hypothetical protein